MKNIYVIPTDKPSRIYLIKSNNKLGITSNNPEFTENFGSGTQNQNIYITSDEEIKVGDWFISLYSNSIQRELKLDCTLNKDAYKKIILTTDQDLIKDGVQAIDDEFLEWFVKNPSCEEVKVEDYGNLYNFRYLILIPKEENIYDEYLKDELKKYKNVKTIVFNKPKEEPRQETTLEEAAVINYKKLYEGEPLTQDVPIDAFIDGAKWQQNKIDIYNAKMEKERAENREFLKFHRERSYSEEEVIQLVSDWTDYRMSEDAKSKVTFKKWFEQFKKK